MKNRKARDFEGWKDLDLWSKEKRAGWAGETT